MFYFDIVLQKFQITMSTYINVLVDFDATMSKTDITLAETELSMQDFK
jgi:hypothetical protein